MRTGAGARSLALLLVAAACTEARVAEPLHAGPDDPVLAPDRPLTYADIRGDTASWMAILAAEDRRASRPGDLETLRAGLGSEHPGIRRAAGRALGRLERPELAGDILPLLVDDVPQVRAEAANALAQALRPGGPGAAWEHRDALASRLLDADEDPEVRAALARSLARLPVADAGELGRLEEVLVSASRLPPDSLGVEADSPPTALVGIARGALFLYRGAVAAGLSPGHGLPERLEEWATSRGPAALRRTALAARLAAGAPAEGVLPRLLEDPDPGVRRLAVTAIPSLSGLAPREEWIARALADPSPEVRLEGARSWGRTLQATRGCAPLMAATEDPADGVALAALDALGDPCPEGEDVPGLLEALAGALPAGVDGSWHRATRAFVTLARVAPERAAPLLGAFVEHDSPFVRAHAARAAGALGETEMLRRLVGDPAPIVREAALPALVPLAGADADSILVAQLDLDDPQLLMTTARLLEGSPEGGPAIPALFRVLGRLSDMAAPTTRDARLAILRRIGELASVWQVAQVDPYLEDIDPEVAAEAARILEGLTGEPHRPRPAGLPPLPLPTVQELRELEGVRAVMVMVGGDTLLIRLLPFEAPTNAARFARMVRDGTFDGLTLHRVAPNFVLQGGSPGANEYAGHGAYTRDETGLVGHWQGTVGISTRGRDTGDGQIFINIVDNLRLDHDYTVFAEVVSGPEPFHRIQEGARIEAITLVPLGLLP
jgi:cyclophilin family peptidyl-prolyl cis-trans isomerase/HEAT repeat protein